MKSQKQILMVLTGLLMGVLFSFQSKSAAELRAYYQRDSKVNFFREIQVIKSSNQKLLEETDNLQTQLRSGNDREETLKNLIKEIEKYKIIAGRLPAEGSGIKLSINGSMEAIWFTDMVNELFSADAEAISVNGYRLAPGNLGFDTLPNFEISLGGNILTPPYNFEAIGDPDTLDKALNQSGGIISRMRSNLSNVTINLEKKDLVKLNGVV